jgi:hypothetical protein
MISQIKIYIIIWRSLNPFLLSLLYSINDLYHIENKKDVKKMAKVILNKKLNFDKERIWTAKNGATRRELVLVNKLGDIGKTKSVVSKVGFIKKGNTSFIYLNPSEKTDKTIGIFLCESYGYTLKKGEEIFVSSSYGGYGNSESKFGIYELGTILEVHSYKHRRGDNYYELRSSDWKFLGKDIPLSEDLDGINCIE